MSTKLRMINIKSIICNLMLRDLILFKVDSELLETEFTMIIFKFSRKSDWKLSSSAFPKDEVRDRTKNCFGFKKIFSNPKKNSRK